MRKPCFCCFSISILDNLYFSLQAWGVRKITLVDNGRVAMSNLLRQSLYTLDNCLNGGEFKATAAVESLKRIFPAVVDHQSLRFHLKLKPIIKFST